VTYSLWQRRDAVILTELFRSVRQEPGSNHVDVGGLVGRNDEGGVIRSSDSRTNTTGEGADSAVGGLVATKRGVIDRSYSAGAADGDAELGGLVARNGGTCRASFWDRQTTGQRTSDCGTGASTDEMQTRSTFATAGWDFQRTWVMDGYPHLQWERSSS
jgi:hypothetical protein